MLLLLLLRRFSSPKLSCFQSELKPAILTAKKIPAHEKESRGPGLPVCVLYLHGTETSQAWPRVDVLNQEAENCILNICHNKRNC